MNDNSRVIAVAAWTLLLGLSGAVSAQEEQEREKVLAAVNQVISDEVRHQAAIQAGKERIVLCAQCHGEDGNSKMREVPNLAGQNPAYLLQQVEKFADGRRKNFVMQSLSRSFTLQDKVNIAVYYASMKAKPVFADPALAREGDRIYHGQCKMCHGEDGRGEAGYARLAGQQPEYVTMTLKRFRENAQNAKQNATSTDVKRHDQRMEQVSQNLSDKDIASLAAYIAALGK